MKTYTITATGPDGLVKRTVEATSTEAAQAAVEAEGLIVIMIATTTDA